MVTAVVVQGEPLNYSINGTVITNNEPIRNLKNSAMLVTDLQQNNVKGYNMLTAVATASAASGVNLFTIPNDVVQNGNTYDNGISYDGINVTSTGTITGVGILFPASTNVGQVFKLTFDYAVTTLTLTVPTGYTLQYNPTSATANQVMTFGLYAAGVWKAL